MSGIKVAAFLVRCSESLLLCQDIDTEHLRFADVEACNSRLPALIAEAHSQGDPQSIVMGRCRFQLETPGPGDRQEIATPVDALASAP